MSSGDFSTKVAVKLQLLGEGGRYSVSEEFVLAVYAKHLQKNWRGTVNQPDLLTILFNAVAMPLGLKNKNYPDYQIEKDKATKIFNRITGGNAPRDIRKNQHDVRILCIHLDQQIPAFLPDPAEAVVLLAGIKPNRLQLLL